jgi:hypothetical protein
MVHTRPHLSQLALFKLRYLKACDARFRIAQQLRWDAVVGIFPDFSVVGYVLIGWLLVSLIAAPVVGRLVSGLAHDRMERRQRPAPAERKIGLRRRTSGVPATQGHL